MACLMAACSTTSGVPDGDQLYTGVTKITYDNYDPNKHAEQIKEELKSHWEPSLTEPSSEVPVCVSRSPRIC